MRTAVHILLACLCSTGLKAQDGVPFFAGRAPLLLDPSRTGFDPGGQVALLHQDQWLQVPGHCQAQDVPVDGPQWQD